jgi:hypothetical protein
LLLAVHEGLLDPKLTFYTDEDWSHQSEYINPQNNRYWKMINPTQNFEIPLHDHKIGGWCDITGIVITGPI